MPNALDLFWWLLLGGFIAAVGIVLASELGLAVLMPYLAKSESDRRLLLTQAAPPMSGHAVWVVLLGGAMVGAWWPLFHATFFSGLWLVLLFFVIAMLVGPIGHGYRSAIANKWRGGWDGLWALAGLASLLVLGMGVGTTISGVPLHFKANGDILWGSFAARYTPYDVLVPGLMAIALGVFLAAARVSAGVTGDMARRASRILIPAGGLAFLAFIGGGIWATQLTGYAIAYPASHEALISPIHGTVFPASGAYLEQFLGQWPQLTLLGSWPLLIVPIFAAVSLLVALFFSWRGHYARAWLLGAMAVFGIVGTAGATTYPIILPSTAVPAQSLTIWNTTMPAPVLIAYLIWLGLLIPAAFAFEVWSRRRNNATGAAASG
ncbi:MAG: cytochrome d ubiquinol oxidase subunit II [Gammaproteobacteria bacterium]